MRLVLSIVLLLAPSIGRAQTIADYNTAVFSWSVPPYDDTNAPEGFALTCNSADAIDGSAVVYMPTTSIPASQVVSGPGTYACTISSFNIIGNSPDSAPLLVQLTGSPVIGIPFAPTNPLVLANPPQPPATNIARIGSVFSLTSNADAGSVTLSIPTNATLIVIGVSGYGGISNYFSGGTMMLGGIPMTAVGADSSTSAFQGAIFYLVSPPTGATTLSWDWTGSSGPIDGVLFAWASYTGVNTMSPVRDTYGAQQADNPHGTTTLTALSGDRIIVWSDQYTSGSNIDFYWTGVSENVQFPNYGTADGSWSEQAPTGSQSVSASASTGSDGGIMAIVLTPAGGN